MNNATVVNTDSAHMAISTTPSQHSTVPAPRGFNLWALGFRPLYLLAAGFATLSIPLWVAQYLGWLDGHVVINGPLWHAHEMIFGFAFAVIIGFLFTAARNWSNQPTPVGATLALIAALWVAARVLAFTPYALAAGCFDGLFAIAAAIGIAVPLVRAGNRRNYFFIALLLGLGLANFAFYIGMAGILDLPMQMVLQTGLDIVLLIMVVMGGRVIPAFTMNGIAGAVCRRLPWLERLAPVSVAALLIADVTGSPESIIGPVAATAAIIHALRFVLWRPWQTRKTPILWILHCSYGWVVVALAMRALASWQFAPPSLAVHALTVGGIGGLTLGMMTRTSLGHTGRPLRAGRVEIFCYTAIQFAAILRVFVPLAFPSMHITALTGSGLLWCAAFGAFTVSYWPVLTRPRVDGKPG